MSLIDFELSKFFTEKTIISDSIDSYEEYIRNWERLRNKYPDWITKTGKHIKIADLEDSHLDNLIVFIARRDCENKTHWIDVLKEEKKYRELKKKVANMKIELKEMEKISEICF